ncbi:MAG TPA: AMP-binding protein, partial [Dongiaceae bacterium]|nr:AMP-binding protein [Dongiaceae bacterium]
MGEARPGIYDRFLERNAANYAALTPLGFLERAAAVYPAKTAVIHGERAYSYREFDERCRHLASALARSGVGHGDTVAVLAGNIPPTLEAHYGVPMVGAVLNALNIRLDPATIAFCLVHGEAKTFIVDREYAETAAQALAGLDAPPHVVEIDDPVADYAHGGSLVGAIDYEAFLAGGDPAFAWTPPEDEWQAIALGYTSGTTG